MKRPRRLFPAGALAAGAVAVAVAGCGGGTHTVTQTVIKETQAPEPASFGSGQGLTIKQIYDNASPGVVDIKVTTTTNGLFGSQSSEGEGAGVVYDTKGDILTDEHVVTTAHTATVTFKDGKTATATVVGTDSSTDVAVIRVHVPSSELTPIPFANSSAAEVGDPVVAIGSPFSLPETATAGIVSFVGRDITAPNNFTITGSIQTDAAINPGNSGGPLLDANGHVLGLNDQIQTNGSSQSAGVGFAIPSNTVAHVANLIIAGKPVLHPYVGVDLDPSYSGSGAEISTSPDAQGNAPVRAGSPAAKAGLRAGDVITAIEGQPITSTEQFIATVDNYQPGQTITLTVKRGSSTLHLRLTLGNRPSSQSGG